MSADQLGASMRSALEAADSATTYSEALAYWKEQSDAIISMLVRAQLAGALTEKEVARKIALIARITAAVEFASSAMDKTFKEAP